MEVEVEVEVEVVVDVVVEVVVAHTGMFNNLLLSSAWMVGFNCTCIETVNPQLSKPE